MSRFGHKPKYTFFDDKSNVLPDSLSKHYWDIYIFQGGITNWFVSAWAISKFQGEDAALSLSMIGGIVQTSLILFITLISLFPTDRSK